MKAQKLNKEARKVNQTKGKVSVGKIFFGVFGLATAGGAIYLLWENMKKLKPNITINNAISPIIPTKAKGTKSKVQNDDFPLRKGSMGARVLALQTALNKLLPEGMASYGGIDGNFGSGTEKALKKAGLSTVIDEAAFTSITGKQETEDLKIIFNPAEIARSLYYAARSANLAEVLNQLRKIKTTKEYADVSAPFQRQGIVKRTIVTDLLDNAFENNDTAKQQIRTEFIRMGLKNDASSAKWSLSGFRLFNDLITLRDTHVEDMQKNKIPVKKGTVLGDEMTSSNGMTFFKAIDNTVGAVPSEDVKYVD